MCGSGPTAGTTTVVAAPAATERRNVKALSIANVDASLGGTVTVEHYNGSLAITLWRGYMIGSMRLITGRRV